MIEFTECRESLRREQKTWLITGCAGFIGSNLMEFLLNHNQKVVGLDNLSTGYMKNIDDVLRTVGKEMALNFSFIKGDISDVNTCQKACQNIDIILHQAALGSVPRSIDNPIRSNQSNVTGFLNIMTSAKDCEVKRFIYASSSSVYGDSEELPKVEERTGNLLSPYAVTKKTNELYASVFSKNYGMETIGLRYFNVFGPRQDPNGAYAAVIPKWINALMSNAEVCIYGDGETSRDFTYIDNVIQMNILAALTDNSKAFGDIFNVAVGGRNTLNQLHEHIINGLMLMSVNCKASELIYKEFRPGDIRHSNANIGKGQKMLGYSPTCFFEYGIKKTVEWFYIKRSEFNYGL